MLRKFLANNVSNNRRNRNRNRNKNINRLRNRDYRKFHIANFPYSVRPSSFGPGTYRLAVTKTNSGLLDPQVTQKLYTIYLSDNPELQRIQDDFKYFKLVGITISFFQRNLPTEGNLYPAYLTINWDELPTENLRLQDNTKIVPSYLPRNKVFKYTIPNINVNGGMLNKWKPIQDLYTLDTVMFQFYAPSNTTSWVFKVDIILVFKGPTAANSNSNKVDIQLNKDLVTSGVKKSDSQVLDELVNLREDSLIQ